MKTFSFVGLQNLSLGAKLNLKQPNNSIHKTCHFLVYFNRDIGGCYKLTNAGWQQFATMKENRSSAAGITYKNKFHVFGGWDYGPLKTTELISIDGGVEYGPELPEASATGDPLGPPSASINSTVSLISGGQTSATSHSYLTWYFNHETNIFSSGPSLLEGREQHGSATVVDKVTTAKIPMVTGGWGNGFVTEDGNGSGTTELLINGHWQLGTIQYPKNASARSRIFLTK